jgi:GNAT superfamily N-acetyltransferase
MDIQIRKAEETDVPGIADLLRTLDLFAFSKTETPQATLNHVSKNLTSCRADDSHSVFVARNPEGEIQGYCTVHWLPYLMFSGPEGYVSELFLRESARGLGIGGQLLETVRGEAEKRGCSRLMLLNLRDRESYKRGFYKKHGWEERPEAVNFLLEFKEDP